MRLVLALAAIVAVALAEKARYDNYQVYRVVPTTEEQVQMLVNLEHTTTDFPFWKSPNKVHTDARILVAPHKRAHFQEIMDDAGLEYSISVPDAQKLFDDEEKLLHKRPKALSWTSYHNLDEIYAWLDELAAKYPSVKVVTAGKSYEGREVRGIEITNGANLPGVILESGIHAREWIAPAATSWIVNQILTADDSSTLKQYNYLYFPISNPDGFSYTWTGDRAWRKTRQPYKVLLITCYGADPNRNWDYHWLEGGSTTNACGETYAGPKAFSEPEVKAIADYFTSVHNRYDIYVGFHSFSQLLMYPWGYTGQDTPLEATWKRIGTSAANALKAVHGKSFDVGSIYDTIYQASGSSIEWYYGMYNSTLTYVFELRDTGDYGFNLPADQIIPSGEELIAAIEVFLTEYAKLPKKDNK